MGAIRIPGKVNDCTTLVDVGMRGLARVTAVYLIEGNRRTCLIDGGTRNEAPCVVRELRRAGSFPPDLVIVTHAHHDHAQGIPILQREAARQGRTLEVLASRQAVPLLGDATYNENLSDGPHESVRPVTPLQENDTVDLGGIELRIFDVPGHSEEQIAILDERHRNLFVGDAIGLKVSDHAYLPPFMPPSWDPVAFQDSLRKLRQIGAETLCLAHFGCIYGQEARDILDEALAKTGAWWQLFEDNATLLDEPDALFDVAIRELGLEIPTLELLDPANGTPGVPSPGEAFVRGLVDKLAQGYRMYWDREPR
jgi:glyoxylase-like metal-dependent hydrolase (beta-lactamase superfamily II)